MFAIKYRTLINLQTSDDTILLYFQLQDVERSSPNLHVDRCGNPS